MFQHQGCTKKLSTFHLPRESGRCSPWLAHGHLSGSRSGVLFHHHMKSVPFLPVAALVCCAILMPSVSCGADKPNIILIYSDDHGFADIGAQGVDKDIRTPNLDQLARDGVRFARGYVSAPQCVPSRAGVITGRYQQRFGVEDNGKGPLPLAELTIAERLKPVGYTSCQIGKWHLERVHEEGAKGGRQAKTAGQGDRKSTRLNSSHLRLSRMPSSA